jgi:hypothetical protein
MACILCIDVDTIVWLFVCADVRPHRREVDLMRVLAQQDPG